MRQDILGSTSPPKALGTRFPLPALGQALDEVRLSVERFCLVAGIEALVDKVCFPSNLSLELNRAGAR